MNAREAREAAAVHPPHIVLLDIMLPGGSGYELVPFFREYEHCRILMLTALNDAASKKASYSSGADDYITKPFDMFELIYKLRAVSRQLLSHMQVIQIGDMTLQTEEHLLHRGEKRAYLQPSQTRLLRKLYLAYLEHETYSEEPAAVPSKGEPDSTYMQISRLRKKIREVDSQTVLIESVYGKGYTLSIIDEE